MNKALYLLCLVLTLGVTLGQQAMAEDVSVQTNSMRLAVSASVGETPTLSLLGATAEALPAYGLNSQGLTAFSCIYADGTMASKLVQCGPVERTTEVAGAQGSPLGGLGGARIPLKDARHELYVTLCYRTYPGLDVIETWTEITNKEKKPVTLLQYASAALPIPRGDVHLTHLYGNWADEAQLCEEPLLPGQKTIRNRDGVRNSHGEHAEVMLSLDGPASELTGRTLGLALCYSGNYRLTFDTPATDRHVFTAGIDEQNSPYRLHSGETLQTPHLAMAYSNEGMSGVSRAFHRWGRQTHLMHADRERDILLNSWEGVYFDINEAGMHQMMRDIHAMGGELFVMDDGWFGSKYQRNTDNAALGDWTVDRRKLPHGIEGLLDCADSLGLKFGIWIEPEMTNTLSELYERHPDWILKAEGYDPECGRGGTQLVLDLANPKVQDYVVSIVDTIMSYRSQRGSRVQYIKWDANMGIQNHGSQYLAAADQSNVYVAYHQGFEKVCQRIREKYPDVVIQACASGGARANWGVLPWFDEFWVSDNTDALQRIYMQWGTSLFFPAQTMGAHIASSPGHQTFRTIPLKFRIDVAMSGRLGMEIQPKNMTDEERDEARQAIAEYKTVRRTIQQGDIYRLLSPYSTSHDAAHAAGNADSGKGSAALMYVAPDGHEAVAFWWKTETFVDQHLPALRLAGLDPDATYTLHELDRIDNEPLPFEGKSYSGRQLMEVGITPTAAASHDGALTMPLEHNVDYHKRTAWSSRVIQITKQ